MTKEQKMVLKQFEKQIQLNLKSCVKDLGCKSSSNTIYFKFDEYYIHVLWFVRFMDNKYQVVLRPYIKPYNYDSVFWKIIKMEDNEKQNDAFRANGAFVAPSIQLSEMTYNVLENDDIEQFCIALINDFLESSKEFISNISTEFVNFDSYVLSLSGIMDESLLKILAYLSLEKYDDAMKIAQNEISQGRTGRFENKGIGFNEYVVKYCR